MKKFVSLFAMAAIAVPGALAVDPSGVTVDKAHGLAWPGGAEVDLNNDGYLDLVTAGKSLEDGHGRVYYDADGNPVESSYEAWQRVWNPATNSYDVTQFQNIVGERVYMAFADFNGDGIMDYFGSSSANGLDSPAPIGLYIGKGDGTFTEQKMTIKDAEGNDFPFRPTALDVADFNNDGKVDLVGIGWWNDENGKYDDNGTKFNVANAVLVNKGDYTFEATNVEVIPYAYALANVVAADLNNDGYADFITIGNADKGTGPTKNGIQLGRAFEVFMNLGQESIDDGELAFYPLDIASSNTIYHQGVGNLLAVDFNNDGYTDILATGESPDDAKPSGDYAFVHQMLINNKEGGFTPLAQSLLGDIRPLNNTHCGTRAIDYTGSGNYDVFIPGWTVTMLDGTPSTQAGWMFKNQGNGVLGSYERFPGGSEVGIFFTEDGVRGARNYYMVGQSWDATYFNGENGEQGRTAAIVKNTNAKSARPDAPTGLAASVDNEKVVLSWAAAASSKMNVSYEYYIKNKATGQFFNSCTSFVGGELDGVRKLLSVGNAFQNTTMTINNMPNGSYEWGVQTINAAYEGSTFATGEFQIVNGGVADFKADNVKVAALGDGIEITCAGSAQAEIYTVSGMLVENAKFADSYNAKLAGGCYLVKVTTAAGTTVKKIIL